MSIRTTPAYSLKREGETGSWPASLPTRQALTRAYILSLLIGLLIALASGAGIGYQNILYPNAKLLLSFIPSDVFNLAIGLPVLLGSMWLARRGVLIGLLSWPGALFYALYMYVPYLIVMPFNGLFLPYLLVITLSAYALFNLVASIDGEALCHRLGGGGLVIISAGILTGLGILVLARQTAQIVAAFSSPRPIDTVELSAWIADFTIAVPALLLVGIKLWRRQALGYIAGPGLLLGYGLLALSLIPFFVYQARHAVAPLDVGSIVIVLVMAGLCFVPLMFFLRRTAFNQRSATS